MSKMSCMCPRCGAEVHILSSKKEGALFDVVCPMCFRPFKVRRVLGVNLKTGLPQEERYEIDPRHIL